MDPRRGHLRSRHVVLLLLLSLTVRSIAVCQGSDPTWEPVNNGLTGKHVMSFGSLDSNLYVGTMDAGGFVSTDYGAQWSQMPDLAEGMVSAFTAVKATGGGAPDTVFAGVFRFSSGSVSGPYRSLDAGKQWKPYNLGMGYPGDVFFVSSLLTVPPELRGHSSDDPWVLAGTDQGMYLLRSDLTYWSEVRSPFVSGYNFVIARANRTLWASSRPSGYGYCRVAGSSDGGQDWIQQSIGKIGSVWVDSAVYGLAGCGKYLFAGTWGQGIYRHADGLRRYSGDTAYGNWAPVDDTPWVDMSKGLTDLFVNVLVARDSILVAGTRSGGVFRSDDFGANWRPMNSGLPAGTEIDALFFKDNYLFAGTEGAGVFRCAIDTIPKLKVWQAVKLAASSAGQLGRRGFAGTAADTGSFIVTYTAGGQAFRAPMMWAKAGWIMWRVPEALMGPRLNVTNWPAAAGINAVERVVERLSSGADIVLRVRRVWVRFPERLLYDERTGPNITVRQATLRAQGPEAAEPFMFIGRPADQHAAIRITNTTRADPASVPADLLIKVISPSGIYYESGVFCTTGNLPNTGANNASQSFPINEEGLYLVVCEAESPESAPVAFNSPGPFPCAFQLLLSGNAGLPQKPDEDGRATRYDTWFNAPAPRGQTLGREQEQLLALGEITQTGLAKFVKEFTPSRYPFAVLVSPTPAGYPAGTPPVRAGDPIRAGLIVPMAGVDPTTPVARTMALYDSIALGDVVDWAQVPLPLPRQGVVPNAGLPGISVVFGEADPNSFAIPFSTVTGKAYAIIYDMGSGNEIVDGQGVDFHLNVADGSYTAAVSMTPFDTTFVPLNGGVVITGSADFDLAGSGLSAARYVRITAAPAVRVDALQAFNQFIDVVDQFAGPLVYSQTATVIARRLKTPAGPLDPYLELIGPDGSFLGENESGFGDQTSPDRSDAALVRKQLPSVGFYRFITRGYPVTPDEQAFGTYFARVETGGEWDQAKILVSAASEAETVPQKSGSMGAPRQRDSYLFEASPGSIIKMSVEGGSVNPLVDPILELYDPEDFLIAASDNYPGRGKMPALSLVLPDGARLRSGQPFPNPSTYRIVVSANDVPGVMNDLPSGGKGYLRQAAAGSYRLKVFTGAMTGGEPALMQISAVNPNAAVQGAAGVIVHLFGANFQANAQVSFSGPGIVVKKVEFAAPGELRVGVDIDAAAPLGKRDVTVSIPGGQTASLSSALDICRSVGKVSLTWDAPAPGSQGPPSNLRSSWSLTTPGSGATVLPAKKATGAAERHPRTRKSAAGGAATIFRDGQPDEAQGITDIQEIEPNNAVSQAQVLTGDTLITVRGRAELGDPGTLDFDDYIEDLYRITTKSPGLTVALDGCTSDCDIYLVDPLDTLTYLVCSDYTGATVPELLEEPELAAGSYLIGVSIYDWDPAGPDTTGYRLTLRGNFGGATPPGTISSYAVYRSVTAGARATGVQVATMAASATSFQDAIPHVGNFFYQVTARYDGGSESTPSNEVTQVVNEIRQERRGIPAEFALEQNYPNPFNPSTTIGYGLPVRSRVQLLVYTLLGQRVAELVSGELEAGYHQTVFSMPGISSGVYFYRLVAQPSGAHAAGTTFVQTRRLCVIR